MRKGTIIVAVSQNGVIGQFDANGKGTIPWHYPADLKRFKQLTSGGTVIMGRKTFESIGRALPKRRNIVVSSKKIDVDEVETFYSLTEAIMATGEERVWYCGGKGIYEEALNYCESIDLTVVPEKIVGNDLVSFPWIDPTVFTVSGVMPDEENKLKHIQYRRIV